MYTVYPLTLKFLTRMRVGTFFKGIRPAQLIAFSTTSSGATLPVTMECCEVNLAVPQQISSFILPLGATINMNGTSLYQGIAALFIADVYGIPLTFIQQLVIVGTATLGAIGTAGVPGAAIIMLSLVLQAVNIPLEAIALVFGVDRVVDMFRTVLNITGDATCAVYVAHTEKKLAKKKQKD
jgi:Na+/H+-dicarboxylate symporter